MRNKNKCIWFDDGYCRHFCEDCHGTCETYQDSLKRLRDIRDITYYQKLWEYYRKYGVKTEGFSGYEEDLLRFKGLENVSDEEQRLTLALIDMGMDYKRFGFRELNKYLKDDEELLFDLSPRLLDKARRTYNKLFADDRFLKLFFKDDSW